MTTAGAGGVPAPEPSASQPTASITTTAPFAPSSSSPSSPTSKPAVKEAHVAKLVDELIPLQPDKDLPPLAQEGNGSTVTSAAAGAPKPETHTSLPQQRGAGHRSPIPVPGLPAKADDIQDAAPSDDPGADADAGADAPADADIAVPEAYEHRHVHAVYEAIAPHFSATRHSPWPLVAAFVRSHAQRASPASAVGLDVGCGNGKYLDLDFGSGFGLNRDGGGGAAYLVGCDRSAALVELARERVKGGGGRGGGVTADVLVGDGLALPFRSGAADFVICVAVIHHLSTRERRQEGIRQLLRCVRRPGTTRAASASASGGTEDEPDDGGGGGEVLVYVWALEQRGSRRGWDEGSAQDLLVPWVMKGQAPARKGSHGTARGSGEEEEDSSSGHTDGTFQRYYHLYRKGELEEDVRAAGGRVLSSGYERDNWWVIATHQSEQLRIGT